MPTTEELIGLAPEIVLTLWAFSLIVMDLFLPTPRKPILTWWSIAGLLTAAATSLALWGRGQEIFSGAFIRDNFTTFLDLVFLAATVISLLIAQRYIRDLDIEYGEYYTLTLLATEGAMIMAGGGDLLTIFLGLEILSLSLYVLAGFRRVDPASQEAALKYFLLGAFASGFLLYGIALTFGATGTTLLSGIAASLAQGEIMSEPLLSMGLGLLGVGLAFKVALVPFHMWTPDVYEGAPSSVTAYMSVVAKAAGFAAALRVFVQAFPAVASDWTPVLAALSVLTMTVGNILALAQTNMKRLLAYSSIAHAGYILLGAVALNSWGLASVLFYLAAYAFMNLGAFAVVIALRDGEREYLALNDYAGLALRKPLLAMSMAVFMLSLAGVPPTAGFLAKFYIFGSAVQAGYGLLAVIAVLNSVLAAFYYLRVIVVMYMGEASGQPAKISVNWALALAIALAVLGTLQMGIFPAPILDLAQATLLPFFRL